MVRIGRFLVAAASLLALFSQRASASDWPSKPVRIIVPFAAGGAADTLGRIFAEPLSKAFGQQFYVENKVGGGGIVGGQATVQAAPDGYTLFVSGMPPLIIAPAMNTNVGYDPIRDFTHIAYFGGPANLIAVHPSLKVKSFQELMALAKSQAEPIEYVSPGFGSAGNLVAELMASKMDIKLRHIPYKGGSNALTDLIGGHVKMGSMTLSTLKPHVRTGALVGIALSSSERIPDIAGVPTFRELGVPDLVSTSWFSLSGPGRMPPDIVSKINHVVNQSLSDPAIRARLIQEDVHTQAMTPEEFSQFVQSQLNKWLPVGKMLANANK
ncbi:MAG: tripartite tricarboxylate transporter substrate binding protein [Pseudolabrys sp.]|nr:tripartite tricarboxylate transporter substrate binding protein [Pseudolabrys sp.]